MVEVRDQVIIEGQGQVIVEVRDQVIIEGQDQVIVEVQIQVIIVDQEHCKFIREGMNYA